tara:strand:- start:104 stop:262 length:159 start_codon:yes stop_codon:yes gene_type:complete
MSDIITTPINTTIPDSAIKPIPADIESGMPRNTSEAYDTTRHNGLQPWDEMS